MKAEGGKVRYDVVVGVVGAAVVAVALITASEITVRAALVKWAAGNDGIGPPCCH